MDFVEFLIQGVIGHEEGEELEDAFVGAEFVAVVEDDGGKGFCDQLSPVADFVHRFASQFNLFQDGDGVTIQFVQGNLQLVVELAMAGFAAMGEAGKHFGLQFLGFGGPDFKFELIPKHEKHVDHLLCLWGVEAGVGGLQLFMEFLEGFVEVGKAFAQFVFFLHFFPRRLNLVVELGEGGLEERFGRKQCGVSFDLDDAFLDHFSDLSYLDQEASVVGLTAFVGGEQNSSLFEIDSQEFELVFKVERRVGFHGI